MTADLISATTYIISIRFRVGMGGVKQKRLSNYLSLRGTAQEILSELTLGELDNFSAISHALTQRFNPPERETAYRSEFRNNRQKRSQNASEYGHYLCKLGSKAFPQIPKSALELITIEQFINSLDDHELRKHVKFNRPLSLDEAISYAVGFDAFGGEKPAKRKNANIYAVASGVQMSKTVFKN